MKPSYTNIKTFRDCPKRYEYKYVMHLPEPEGIELKVGTAGHKVLEKYYQLSKERRCQQFINELIFIAFEKELIIDNQVREILMEALDGYHEWAEIKDKNIEIIEVERPINVQLGDYVFTGKIDAVGKIDNREVLLEHKFKGQWGVDVAEQFIYDEQNKGYAMATGCREIIYNLIRTKPAKTRPKFERIRILVPEHEITRFKEDLGIWNTKIEEAKRSNEFPRNRGYGCKYCPFKPECWSIKGEENV